MKADLTLPPLEFLPDGSYRSMLVSPKITGKARQKLIDAAPVLNNFFGQLTGPTLTASSSLLVIVEGTASFSSTGTLQIQAACFEQCRHVVSVLEG